MSGTFRVSDQTIETAARDAVVREHHKLFQAAQAALGSHPTDFDDLSERSQRLKHNQLDPLADAVLAAVLPKIREQIASEIEAMPRRDGWILATVAAARVAEGGVL